MATAAIQTTKQPDQASSMESCSSSRAKQGEGLRQYYLQHIHDLQLPVRQKSHNLSRLETQRNDLNSKGKQKGYRHGFASYNALTYCLNRTNQFRAADQVPELMTMQGNLTTRERLKLEMEVDLWASRVRSAKHFPALQAARLNHHSEWGVHGVSNFWCA